MKPSILSYIALPARIYLGIVFLLACYHKIMHPESFALDVASYQFLPLYLINIFALIVPMVELFTGVLIIIGFKARANALLIAGMMISFIIALSWALYQGLDMSCGCFASSTLEESDPISYMTLLRDGFWLALALFVFLADKTPLGLDYFLLKRKYS